jgi:cell wall-associated NlpC family hydrolase
MKESTTLTANATSQSAVRVTRSEWVKAARATVGIPYKAGATESGANCLGNLANVARRVGLDEFAEALQQVSTYNLPTKRQGLLHGLLASNLVKIKPKRDMALGDLLLFETGYDQWSLDYRHLAILTSLRPRMMIHADPRYKKVVECRMLPKLVPTHVWQIVGVID